MHEVVEKKFSEVCSLKFFEMVEDFKGLKQEASIAFPAFSDIEKKNDFLLEQNLWCAL